MKIARPISRLKGMFARRTQGDQVSDRVRRNLVQTLYNQPLNLAFGAATGIAATAAAAWITDLRQLWAGLAVLSIVACFRVIDAYSLRSHADTTSTARLEILYELGAFTYSLVLGTVASMTLWYDAAVPISVMMIANALCFGVGVAARNAARPTIAIGQLALVCLPIAGVCLAIGGVAHLTLVATIVVLIPTMGSITFSIFRMVQESFAAAERSAALAHEMQELARTDVVTGLSNRAGLNHAMVEMMMSLSEDDRYALVWIDLDRFKEVNDLLGHPAGDEVLNKVGKRLREVCGSQSTISRFGGDEFILFCPIEDRKDAEKLGSEIHAEIMRPMQIGPDMIDVRASIGIAVLPDDGQDVDILMQRADLALYHAKVNGRGQTCFFDVSMTRDLVRRREIEDELRRALKRDELSIFFQPIIDLESGKIRSFEALVRWFHPEKGELTPDEFIPVAEESGVIITLGNWITSQAAQAAAKWPEDISLSVNLSPLQIRAPGAALGIISAIHQAGLDPHRLELEVTESLFVEDNHATANFIQELSSIGVRFSLDDFGTGYSSLGYINAFPFQKIKVDRSFVSGKEAGPKSDAIIRAVAEMGTQLDMAIVAEGIETVEQLQSVRAAGCTMGQGFYFSRAVPDYLASMLLAQEREAEQRKIA